MYIYKRNIKRIGVKDSHIIKAIDCILNGLHGSRIGKKARVTEK